MFLESEENSKMIQVPEAMLALLFRRRSIRKFKNIPIPDNIVRRIVEAGQRAPTAGNLQTYSVIWVKDRAKRNRILQSCRVPKSISKAPVILAVCADIHRLTKVLDSLNYQHCLRNGYGYVLKLLSIIDASLVAENMVIASECFGLGSVLIGSALANDKIIYILNLPKGVLPLFLLCIGYADENPPTRPRWPLSCVLYTNNYRKLTKEEINSFLSHMNQNLRREGYYKKYALSRLSLRGLKQKIFSGHYGYTEHIKRKTSTRYIKKSFGDFMAALKEADYLPTKSS